VRACVSRCLHLRRPQCHELRNPLHAASAAADCMRDVVHGDDGVAGMGSPGVEGDPAHPMVADWWSTAWSAAMAQPGPRLLADDSPGSSRHMRSQVSSILSDLTQSLRQIRRVVNDVLSFQALSSGAFDVNLSPVSIRRAVVDAARLLQPAVARYGPLRLHASVVVVVNDSLWLPHSGISFQVHIAPRVPDSVLMDLLRVEQVLHNGQCCVDHAS
jgi:signal transduction histidine kinase